MSASDLIAAAYLFSLLGGIALRLLVLPLTGLLRKRLNPND